MTSQETPFELLFNHVALPRILPGKADGQPAMVDRHLTTRLITATEKLRSISAEEPAKALGALEKSLRVTYTCNQDTRLNKATILAAFQNLQDDEGLVLHVTEQNAGLLIRRESSEDVDDVVFETFEASPKSESVLEPTSALIWDFPGTVVSIPYDTFVASTFQDSLAAFLSRASTEQIKQFQAVTKKAGVSVVETRDTAEPSLISSFLTSLLEATSNGRRLYPPLLRKRVRDDVCWNNAKSPWRRAPLYLVLRVSIQRLLYLRLGGKVGRVYYKFLTSIFLTHFLSDSLTRLCPELYDLVKAKLCRRIAKLEGDQAGAAPQYRSHYERLFLELSPFFQETLHRATRQTNYLWNGYKERHRHRIPSLPEHAAEQDTRLSLPNSKLTLQRLLLGQHHVPSHQTSFDASNFNLDGASGSPFRIFADRYISLAISKNCIEKLGETTTTSRNEGEILLLNLINQADSFVGSIGNDYEGYPEQLSKYILIVFELWMSIDKLALRIYPLLTEYHPGVRPQILDILHLPSLRDMYRLQKLQMYLRSRCMGCSASKLTIFANPEREGFACRYMDELEGGHELRALDEQIQSASDDASDRKEEELRALTAKYDAWALLESQTQCDEMLYADGTHDNRIRRQRKMKIAVHEDYLPSKDSSESECQRKTVVFELRIPNSFSRYRDITWKLLTSMCSPPVQSHRPSPITMMLEYPQLRQWADVRASASASFALGSTTKPFLATHYNQIRLPAAKTKVIYPHGLQYEYYDTTNKIWRDDVVEKPSLAHLFAAMPFALNGLVVNSKFVSDAADPSSYQILASQTYCPSDVNIHEFTGFQTLRSGKNRRWLAMLVELASSNINFSNESTLSLFSYLTSQAGPGHGTDVLRVIHIVFRDPHFCQRLLDLIQDRVSAIASNWRENYFLEMLLSLTLRLWELGTKQVAVFAIDLIEEIRKIALRWIRQLRTEARMAQDEDVAQRATRYGLWASLICRRTFYIYSEGGNSWSNQSLQDFIEASIALQENIDSDPRTFPVTLRSVLVRDIETTYFMRERILNAIKKHQDGLQSAINEAWPQSDNHSNRSFSEWAVVTRSTRWWVTAIVGATQFTNEQTVYFNFIDGGLLIDGKPLGALPSELRKHSLLTELFGDQHLLSFPSGMPGMTYVLDFNQGGHVIHLGLDSGKLTIKATVQNTVLQLVDRRCFGEDNRLDIPKTLVENCTHWLNLSTGIMEIRRHPHVWVPGRTGNWNMNFYSRKATRRGKAFLVDPHSNLAKSIADLFRYFENPWHLTIFQPIRGKLSLEMKRLDLSWVVTRHRLLFCRQLRAEIDPHQDIGTLYGFRSKIVVRDIVDPLQRSVIIPVGEHFWKRDGIHVTSRATNEGIYMRFTVDSVLGRLECPPEPLLLYSKALLHALTSFIVPDPLTGRTGTEEALHCLQSARCQPWCPVSPGGLHVLTKIAGLSPRRHYYPKDMKNQQTLIWDERLTRTVQHDNFRPTVEAILTKSKQISVFSPQEIIHPRLDPDNLHLHLRGAYRGSLYSHSDPCFGMPKTMDLTYAPRDRPLRNKQTTNVYEVVSLLRGHTSSFPTARNLAAKLKRWPVIGGFNSSSAAVTLSEFLDVDIIRSWGFWVNLCRKDEAGHSYRLMFQMGLIAFAFKADMEMVRTLIAFHLFDLKNIAPPPFSSFIKFDPYGRPCPDRLETVLGKDCYQPGFDQHNVSDSSESATSSESSSAHIFEIRVSESAAAPNDYEALCVDKGRELVQAVLKRWPSSELSVQDFESLDLRPLNISKALEMIRPEWQRLIQNLELTRYLERVQEILNKSRCEYDPKVPSEIQTESTLFDDGKCAFRLPSLRGDLMTADIDPTKLNVDQRSTMDSDSAPSTGIHGNTQQKPFRQNISPEIKELESIIEEITDTSHDSMRKQYVDDLRESLEALKIATRTPEVLHKPVQLSTLNREIVEARQNCRKYFDDLCSALAAGDPRRQWLLVGGQWPRLNPISLLEQLRSTSNASYGDNIKSGLVCYALLLIKLQRLLRIRHWTLKPDARMVQEELSNTGHTNWEPMEYTDWLLLELDMNILVRRNQVDVALAMISPPSGSNTVLQMNMGQGKTSCVMPMVAAVLANGKQLTRVIVPKALLQQTAQTLQTRLGGLIGREIRHIPFSRKSPSTDTAVELYRKIHNDVLNGSGVILGLPEHLLSFMLSGRQSLSNSRIHIATALIETQQWMSEMSRDILDECDFSLSVKTQLIYPSGSQLTIDGHPRRWEVAEDLLGLAAGHLSKLQQDSPHAIQIISTKGAFPAFYFLKTEAEDALMAYLVDDICAGRTSILPKECLTKHNEALVRAFISAEAVGPELVAKVSRLFPQNPSLVKNIYLMRGLIVHKILLLCLKKRWNVQYGLHPGRDPLAVPYMGKGLPSEQSEFGHPDVAITLTCTAFYYNGLDLEQLRQALQHALNSDDPSAKYDSWVHSSSTLPESLRHWVFINIEDDGQVTELWHHLKYSKVVIDYFLNTLVFPIHAKQFSLKLQASGWDLPSFSKRRTDDTKALTTGFSGTNDNRRMLPLSIQQHDLPALSHTNAEVLTYLLQDRNREYHLAASQSGTSLTEQGLLARLSSMSIRILIDAGAYILEMDNRSVVKAWMDFDSEAKAAVYFGDDNKAWVYSKVGRDVPLLASHFAENLSECLVYLDEIHTRGTDLKLHPLAWAALTLGPGQTKDFTLQAAMRLRQLAVSQSVAFFAPPQVHKRIQELRQKRDGDILDSSDVIHWLLEMTKEQNEQQQQLYIAQGRDFCRRMNAAWEYPKYLVHSKHRAAYLSVLRQPELKTLEELYKPKFGDHEEASVEYRNLILQKFQEQLQEFRSSASPDVFKVHGSVLEEVEQEREVAYEVEEVREIQKPIHFKPLPFPGVQDTIMHFAMSGELPGHGYEHIFVALARTEIALKYGLSGNAGSSQLYVSMEFSRTVQMRARERNDNFLRPVHWILWSPKIQTAFILIPEEAEVLIPVIRDAEDSPVHLLLYVAPVTKKMLNHFDDLKFYSIPELPRSWVAPSWLKTELGLFSGRLHFSLDEYASLESYLARAVPSGFNAPVPQNKSNATALPVPQKKKRGKTGLNTRKENQPPPVPQNTVKPAQDSTSGVRSNLPLGERPLNFMQEYLAVKRKGQDFTHTPMGYLCSRRVIQADHPFFVKEIVPDAAEKRSMKRIAHRADRKSSARKTTSQGEDYDSDESMYEDAQEDIVADMDVWKGEERVEDSESESEDESKDEDDSD